MYLNNMKPFREMIDPELGTVDRRIFVDQDIYELELERVFGRAWNFMCHESQIPKPGDFFLNFIGEDSVIATRDRKGQLQVMLNSCRHRGNAVCRAESGNARSFLCTYHGWTYDLEGALVGVPGYKDLYHSELDKDQWGLIKAAKVASYKGFVFATLDPEAPELEDFLGPVGKLGLEFVTGRGTIKAVEGIQKNVIGCNWKFAVDNLFDMYHGDITHASVGATGERKHSPTRGAHRVAVGSYGHAIAGPRLPPELFETVEDEAEMDIADKRQALARNWRAGKEALELFGDMRDTSGHPSIFPSLWVTQSLQVSLRLPKGPNSTEIWWFTFVSEEEGEDVGVEIVKRAIHGFGPAGLWEQEDGENWDQSTRGVKSFAGRNYPLNLAMNVGRADLKTSANGVVYADTTCSEHGQLWTWRCWADWMDAESWPALRAAHTDPTKLSVI